MNRQEAIDDVTRRILACRESPDAVRALVGVAYGYGHLHACETIDHERVRLHSETLEPNDEPMREATWQCYQCERRGTILHDKRAGVWEITQKIGKDHQATSPGCPASYRELGILLQLDMNALDDESGSAHP